MKKFEEIENRNKNKPSKTGWFSDCGRKQVPYIVIYLKTKFANVHWDYITYHPSLDGILSDKENEFIQKVESLYTKYSNEKTYYSINCYVVTLYNLDIELARQAASELYDLVDSHIKNITNENKSK